MSSEQQSEIAELLRSLAEAIVDAPDEVEVSEHSADDDDVTVLELRVDSDDFGKVIGRGGRTAYALRTIVKVAATRSGKRIHIDIVDE